GKTDQPGDDQDDLRLLVPAQPVMPPRTRQAIDKGVAYLKQRLRDRDPTYYYGQSDDPHVGATALAGLTLLECGVPPADESVQQAVSLVRARAGSLRFTYSLALCILFLDRFIDHKEYVKDARDGTLIQGMALQLIAAQQERGGWRYQSFPLSPAEEGELL